MKKLKIIFFIVLASTVSYFGAKTFRSLTTINSPTEIITSHFTISYRGIYSSEAQDIADHLESSYDRIRSDLKDPTHEKIRVFVHPSQTDFNKATGLLKSSANGTSRGPNEFHILWTNWFNSIFPDNPEETAVHEFTHCVQLNILIKYEQNRLAGATSIDFDKMFEEKFVRKYPQWFWEGLCDYEAGMVNNISVKYGMTNNPSLRSLSNSNQIYNVGYTIIEYIADKWGKDKLPLLITSYVDIESILKVSESEFEKGWIEFVEDHY